MKRSDLAQEIEIEFEAIQATVEHLALLRRDVRQREPTVREMAAAGLFLANFYNGIENVLKRICRFSEFELPTGSDSHLELTKLVWVSSSRVCPTLTLHHQRFNRS